MNDLYLRAGNAGALVSACPFLRGESEDGERFWITDGDGWALDVIGAVTATPGTYHPETGKELTPPVMADGFHVNLRCTEEIAALVPDHFKLDIATPKRTWL